MIAAARTHIVNMFYVILVVKIRTVNVNYVGLGGLGVTCSPQDPRFAGLNAAEVNGFFQNIKILIASPPGGTLNRGS